MERAKDWEKDEGERVRGEKEIGLRKGDGEGFREGESGEGGRREGKG